MAGLFGALSAGISRKSGNETTRLGSIEEIWRDLFARPSKSGVSVTWQTALKITTALACVRRIAEGTSSVPVKLYKREGNSRAEARDHSLYEIIGTQPSVLQNSLEYRETKTFHCAVAGNAYSLISRVNGRIAELVPMDPERVTVKPIRDGTLAYKFRPLDGPEIPLSPADVWHLRGPSWNGWAGIDAIAALREAMGLAIAAENTQSALHANGGRAAGILSFKDELGKDARDKIKEAWAAVKEGSVAVLDNEATYKQLALSSVDQQHLDTRRFQVEEICRGLGVMPIMVGLADKVATYSSAEQMFLAHLIHTVRPWHRRFEYSMQINLLTAEERKQGYYFGFVDQEFMRAAAKDRAEYNKTSLGGGASPGWRTLNEVRADDEQPPVPGGDRIYAPLNAGPIGADGVPIGGVKPATTTAPQPPQPSE